MATIEIYEAPGSGGPLPAEARAWQIDPQDTAVPLQALQALMQHVQKGRAAGLEPHLAFVAPVPPGADVLGQHGYLGCGLYPKDKN